MPEPNKPLEQMTAQERLDLGRSYFKEGKFDKAIAAWSNIHRDDDPGTYADAQFSLGAAYYAQEDWEQAIAAWSNIHRDDNPKTYARAQFNLGVAYKDQNKRDKAIAAWSNITRDDNPETYAWAQFNLGVAYKDQHKRDKAIAAWSNIHRDDNPETYARAQLNLGKIYAKSKKVKEAKEAYRNAREFFYYEGERGYRIHECPPEVIKKLRDIAKNTDKVLKSLQIIPKFESKVAHYSQPSTAFSLFGDEKNDKNPSNFRLNTIRGVNDPTEGLVLRDYWDQQGIPETIHTSNTATFVSCFTFNHDSLNQFRLYGKEDGREATGVSLVFKEEFFSDQPDTLGFIAGPSIDPSNKSGENESGEAGKSESDNKIQLIAKSALYRCIYLDPETGYWTLAQRDKSNFYRQHKEKAEKKWKKYYKSLSKKEKSVNKHLFAKDKSVLSTLQSIFGKYQGYSIKEKQHILETIRFILLPLQYLVKHIAFQEEQECRIMYTTHLHDEKIHHDWEKQWMYVEYKEQVLPHIDKIWLSPGAAKYQDFFRILLDQGSGKSKVRISQNPFRNKE